MKKIRKKGKNKNPSPVNVASDGTILKSRLELYFYNKCIQLGIPVEYEPTTYEVFPAFRFQDRAIQNIKYTPDFSSSTYIVEIKGYNLSNNAFDLRFKLFKKYMVDNKIDKKLYLLKNQKQVNEALEEIKQL